MQNRPERKDLVSQVVRGLPRLPRLAFLLKYADGLSVTETSKVLGVRREEAFEHLWAARRAAKEELKMTTGRKPS